MCLQSGVLQWQKLLECDLRGHLVQRPQETDEEAETMRGGQMATGRREMRTQASKLVGHLLYPSKQAPDGSRLPGGLPQSISRPG